VTEWQLSALLCRDEAVRKWRFNGLPAVLGLVAQAKDGNVEELGGPCEGWMRDLHGFVFDSPAQAREGVHLQESGCEILFEQNTSPPAIEVSQWADDLWHRSHSRRPH
jgi:hypothetical protein